jgi:hypothetical protein
LLAAAVLATPAESLLAAAAVPARQHAGASTSPPRLLAMKNKAESMENKLKSMEVDVCDEATFVGHQGCPLALRPPVLEEVLAAAKEKVPSNTIVCRRMEVFAPDSESPELAPDSLSLSSSWRTPWRTSSWRIRCRRVLSFALGVTSIMKIIKRGIVRTHVFFHVPAADLCIWNTWS